MRRKTRLTAVLGVCGLAMPALAQDSVSIWQGLPGDAVSAYDTTEQVNRYVVDLVDLTSSWGNQFGIAPILKNSRALLPTFFTTFSGAQALSVSSMYNVCNPSGGQPYAFWNTAGPGVNAVNNSAGQNMQAPARGVQFGVALSESDGNLNSMLGGSVFYDPRTPTRLYVTRVNAAVNGFSDLEVRSSFGLGAVDANGNLAMRADGFGAFTLGFLEGNNYFRMRLGARNPSALNVIDNSGPSDAGSTTWIDMLSPPGAPPASPNSSATTHNTPSLIPQGFGARPVVLGTNFDREYVFEQTPGVLASDDPDGPLGPIPAAHLAGVTTDHRGNAYFSHVQAFSGTVGTTGMIGINNGTDTMLIWGVNADGSIGTTGAGAPKVRGLAVPASVTDNDDGFNPAAAFGPQWFDGFRSYAGSVAFRGGNGQVAVGRDQQGRTLVAATAHMNTGAGSFAGHNNPVNAILVARITGDALTGAVEWTLAAHNFRSAALPQGKAVKDGPGGVPVGRLIRLCEITQANPGPPCSTTNSVNRGPSMSSPVIDSVGNLWFLATAELYNAVGQIRDRDPILIRAVYNPATFSYELEQFLEISSTFTGLNSATPFRITRLEIAGSSAVSTGTIFAGNVLQTAAHDMSTAGLSTSDPRTLGGLVLSANLVYDTNGDGQFIPDDDPFNMTPSDEAYRAVMFIGPKTAGAFCAPDVNRDGALNLADFGAFQTLFALGDRRADTNCDGVLNLADFGAYQTSFALGCP